MKKPLALIYLFNFIVICTASAQELKNVSRDTMNYREKFQVLKSNKSIRQGTYMLMSNSSGKVLTTGFYKNNQRDSIWRDYNYQDHVIAEGHYTNGRKTGEWKYFDDRWVPADTYDYDKNVLIYHRATKQDSTTSYRIITGKDTLYTIPDQPPIYLGGDAAKYRSMLYSIRYPAEARMKGITGKVVVAFILDENGKTQDYHVTRSIGYGCDEEALKAVKQIPNNWLPARYKGKNVATVMAIPVSFNLSK